MNASVLVSLVLDYYDHDVEMEVTAAVAALEDQLAVVDVVVVDSKEDPWVECVFLATADAAVVLE